MKFKIGIITFHSARNYGAVLQCAAMIKYLSMRGYDVKVINYCPDYLKESIVRNPFKETKALYAELSGCRKSYRVRRSLRRMVGCLVDNKNIPQKIRRKKAFEDFVANNIPLTEQYTSYCELQKAQLDMDAYICGSDQIWNASLTNGELDPAFFLAFGEEHALRIAYAVSVFNANIELEEQFKCLLSNLDAITLRESKYKMRIQQWSQKTVGIMPDPSLLLQADDYRQFEEPIDICKPYIFVYLLSKENAVNQCEQVIASLQEKANLAVIEGSPYSHCKVSGTHRRRDLSPGEWLYLIRNASHVITNSFHCLTFSLVYKKDVFVLPCPKDRIERLTELVECTCLKHRFINSCNEVSCAIDSDIDYSNVLQYLQQEQNKANSFFGQIFRRMEMNK